jgi:hypothetical protein
MNGNRWIPTLLVGSVLLFGGLIFPASGGETEKRDQASIVASEVSTISYLLAVRPQTALDFSGVSGEYCFDVHLGDGGHMTHYAIDPTKTQEDVIDFVNAEPLVKVGVKVENLPQFPGTLGSMAPNQWYFLPAGELEPHHGMKFPFPLLLKAVNIN